MDNRGCSDLGENPGCSRSAARDLILTTTSAHVRIQESEVNPLVLGMVHHTQKQLASAPVKPRSSGQGETRGQPMGDVLPLLGGNRISSSKDTFCDAGDPKAENRRHTPSDLNSTGPGARNMSRRGRIQISLVVFFRNIYSFSQGCNGYGVKNRNIRNIVERDLSLLTEPNGYEVLE